MSSIELKSNPTLVTRSQTIIPSRTLAVLNVKSTVNCLHTGKLHDVQVNPLLNKEHPNLSIISTLHWVECDIPHIVPSVAVNLSYDPITIEKGLVLGFLIPQEIDISEISTETAQIPKLDDFYEGYDTERSEESNVTNKLEKSSFIISPADIEVHQKAALKSAEVSTEHLEAFNQLCDKYKDVFSVDSSI